MRRWLIMSLLCSSVFSWEREWTVLVYVGADEAELDPYARVALRKMEQVGSDQSRAIIADVDFHFSDDGLTVDGEPARRYEIEYHPGPIHPMDFSTLALRSPIVWTDTGESDSASGDRLFDFLEWGVRRYPARHYGLILIGHSWGWRGLFQDFRPGFDVEGAPVKHDFTMMSAADLERAVRRISSDRWLDWVMMDVCHAGTLEIAHAFRHVARWYVGGATEIPYMSYDYRGLLETSWESIPRALALNVVDTIRSFARDGNQIGAEGDHPAINLFTIDMEKMDPIWSYFEWLKTQPVAEFDALFLGKNNSKFTDLYDHVDLQELVAHLTMMANDSVVRERSSEILALLKAEHEPFDTLPQWFRVSESARRFRLWIEGDEGPKPAQALQNAKDQFRYLNVGLEGLPMAKWKLVDRNGMRVYRVDIPVPKTESFALRPFLAGSRWVVSQWLDASGKPLSESRLFAPDTYSVRSRFPARSPYVISGNTFGTGRNRGLAVQIGQTMDPSLSENYAYLDGRWVFGQRIYFATPFARQFGWGTRIFGKFFN